MTTTVPRTGVLFVCLGNICRSPLAEGIFLHLARERGVQGRFDVDSCGTGAWHVGQGADPRSVAVARRHGVTLEHEARQLDPRSDFDRFHLLIAMDRSNRRSIIHAAEAHSKDSSGVRMMRSFGLPAKDVDATDVDVPDPYSGGDEGFQVVYDMLRVSCAGLLTHLLERGPTLR